MKNIPKLAILTLLLNSTICFPAKIQTDEYYELIEQTRIKIQEEAEKEKKRKDLEREIKENMQYLGLIIGIIFTILMLIISIVLIMSTIHYCPVKVDQ